MDLMLFGLTLFGGLALLNLIVVLLMVNGAKK